MHQSPHTTGTELVPTKQRLVSECCDVLSFHVNLSTEVSIVPVTLAVPANGNCSVLPRDDHSTCPYFF